MKKYSVGNHGAEFLDDIPLWVVEASQKSNCEGGQKVAYIYKYVKSHIYDWRKKQRKHVELNDDIQGSGSLGSGSLGSGFEDLPPDPINRRIIYYLSTGCKINDLPELVGVSRRTVFYRLEEIREWLTIYLQQE